MDKETRKIMRDGRELAELIKGDGWSIVRGKLFAKISELNNILAFGEEDMKDPQKLMLNMAANQQAIKVLLDWLADVEGDVSKYKNYFETLQEEQQDEYIKQYE